VTVDAGHDIVRNLELRADQADDRCRAAEIDRDAARAAVTEARQRYGAQ